MSFQTRKYMTCDWPACYADYWSGERRQSYILNTAKSEEGWLEIFGMHFCPQRHAAPISRGDHQPIRGEKLPRREFDPVARYRWSCTCGWAEEDRVGAPDRFVAHLRDIAIERIREEREATLLHTRNQGGESVGPQVGPSVGC